MKKILLALLALPVLVPLLFILHNNLGNQPLHPESVDAAYQRSLHWLDSHRQEILNQDNAILWWMLIEANRIQPNPMLNTMIEEYRSHARRNNPGSPWNYLILDTRPTIDVYRVLDADLPDYNVYFIYAFSCNPGLAETELVRMQHDTGFCFQHHPVSPACTTHQMMGFRFLQRFDCAADFDLQDSIDTLAARIETMAVYDFRLVDVYLQRLLMLADIGRWERIKPRWIHRILAAQHEDGGWSNIQPLLPLGNERYIGFTGRGMGIGRNRSGFHTTAQGLLLMTLLNQHLAANTASQSPTSH